MSQDLELDEITEKIFSGEPSQKFSIQIEFENSNLHRLFESLLMITTYGMKKKFSNQKGKVDLAELSATELEYFNGYLRSFGMELKVDVENYDIRKDYEKLKYKYVILDDTIELKDLCLPILNDNGLVYIISFDYYSDYA